MTAAIFTCKCCEMSCLGPDLPDSMPHLHAPFSLPPELCVTCEGHKGDIARLQNEHAMILRRHKEEADDVAALMAVERGELRRQILDLERSLDRALDALNRATLFHRRRIPLDDCSCGQPHCETCTVGSEPWVYEQIREMKARKASGE